MKQNAFISIDIDYWWTAKDAFDTLNKFFNKLYLSSAPMWKSKGSIVAVQNHQQLLPCVNSHPADILINVDTHSDICSEESLEELNCGTWVSYVKWRKESYYLWVRPGLISVGNCQGNGSSWNSGHRWLSAKTQLDKQNLDLTVLIKEYNIVGVGFCMSPGYIQIPELEKVFKKLVKLYKIPYTRGRRDEDTFSTILQPPK